MSARISCFGYDVTIITSKEDYSYVEVYRENNKAIITLGTYKTESIRLFTLFHELGHLSLRAKLGSMEYDKTLNYLRLLNESISWAIGIKMLSDCGYYPDVNVWSRIYECLSSYAESA
jgi:hypothetical protein